MLEKTLRVPWTARRSNQSILKETSPEYSLEGLMLKLNLQYCGHLMWRTDSLEKILMLGKIEGRRRRGRQRMKWLDGITNSMDMSLSTGRWWRTGNPGMLQSLRLKRDTTEQLNNNMITMFSCCRLETCYWQNQIRCLDICSSINNIFGNSRSREWWWLRRGSNQKETGKALWRRQGQQQVEHKAGPGQVEAEREGFNLSQGYVALNRLDQKYCLGSWC